MKAWLIGGGISLGLGILWPFIRKQVISLLGSAAASLFGAALKLKVDKFTDEQNTALHNLIFAAVVFVEKLIPDSKMGDEKKQKILQYVPLEYRAKASELIDLAVEKMNAEALQAIAKENKNTEIK